MKYILHNLRDKDFYGITQQIAFEIQSKAVNQLIRSIERQVNTHAKVPIHRTMRNGKFDEFVIVT